MPPPSFFVYILECQDGSFYTGFTLNLLNRMSKHELGKGSKYVRAKKFKKLLYFEAFKDESLARKREIEIKKLKRAEKELLVKKFR